MDAKVQNEKLTAGIAYLLLWKHQYKKARFQDGEKDAKVEKEIKELDFFIDQTKEALYKNYWLE